MLFVVVHVGSDEAGAEIIVEVDAADMGAAVCHWATSTNDVGRRPTWDNVVWVRLSCRDLY